MSENSPLQNIEPKQVWSNFSKLNAVPRASKKEERVIQFMVDFGKSLNLETKVDQVGNVIIKKPATSDMQDRKTVVLQSHLDMVHQKNNDTHFDFDTQGIEMFIEGDWVKAKGTTLGADNGLGVAAIMSLLESTDIAHPALEALFTIDEETGMTGAMGLQGGELSGEILLNLDTEEDDEIGVGCAGGVDITGNKTYQSVEANPQHQGYKITVNGLQGGHSGMDIHKGLGNANKLINRILYALVKSTNIHMIDGGGLRNAIPRESNAIITADNATKFEEDFHVIAENIKAEFSTIEPNISITYTKTPTPENVMTKKDQETLVRTIYGIHNGVFRMSPDIKGLVETSNNLARVLVKDGNITVMCLTRSSVESGKMNQAFAIESTLKLGGFDVEMAGDYPGWKPNPQSPILKVLDETYEHLFAQKAHILACHAGLECGILGRNYPTMDMISFGPTIRGAHSPDEKASISSTQKFWKFLIEILKNTPKN